MSSGFSEMGKCGCEFNIAENSQTQVRSSLNAFVGNLNKDETFSLLYTAEGQSILKIVSILTYNVPCTRKG